MSGKILIFGGSGGIGSQTAQRLSARGYSVHLVGRNEAVLQKIAEDIGATFSVADVTEDGAISHAVSAAGAHLAGLVYALGTISLKPLARLTAQDIEKDFRINALGAALAVQAALPALKASGSMASIVLFSSVAVSQGFPSHASIAMAKGAIEGLTRALAAELAPSIRVNAIAPSLTRTALAKSFTDNAQMAKAIADMHPLQRLGEPHDAAALAAFLISGEAGWMTGQVIGVDGGRATLRTKG